MKLTHLIPMAQFVIEQEFTEDSALSGNEADAWRYNNCLSYAEFLQKPIELWMLVPCDDNGQPVKHRLECPLCDYGDSSACQEDHIPNPDFINGKERVLFEGFALVDTMQQQTSSGTTTANYAAIEYLKENGFNFYIASTWNKNKEIKLREEATSIDYLTPLNLKLTPAGIQMIGA